MESTPINTSEYNSQLATIKKWLGTGSINIFGLPMSGKDTVGVRLAEALGARFLSSGLIIRAMNEESHQTLGDNGQLIPTNVFYEWVLPYFERKDLRDAALVLSSVGRWSGEEDQVMNVAAGAGHPIKAVVALDLPEAEVRQRWQTAQTAAAGTEADRGARADDATPEIFEQRLAEFAAKTMPVLAHYEDLGLLIHVNGAQTRDQVFAEAVQKLAQFAASTS